MSVNEANVVRYRIDPSRSRFTVQAFAAGLFSAFGHNPVIAIRGFGGDARCVPGTLAEASLLLLVQSRSLAVADRVSDKDRREIERMMREEALETARYPEIVFMSAKVSANCTAQNDYRVRIDGNLSLHGIMRPCPIDARVTVNENNLRAQGEFSLRQTDYQIKPVSVAGGTLKVKDELKFSFDILSIADCGLQIAD